MEIRKTYLTNNGYKAFKFKGKKLFEHRYVMEQFLGRKLLKGEVVHHINKVRDDNRIENLKLYSNNVEHRIAEHKGGKICSCNICGKEFYRKPYNIKIGWDKYCSKNCQAIDRSRKRNRDIFGRFL